jgi:hypothetical protein
MTLDYMYQLDSNQVEAAGKLRGSSKWWNAFMTLWEDYSYQKMWWRLCQRLLLEDSVKFQLIYLFNNGSSKPHFHGDCYQINTSFFPLQPWHISFTNPLMLTRNNCLTLTKHIICW